MMCRKKTSYIYIYIYSKTGKTGQTSKCAAGFLPGQASLAYFFFLGSESEKNVAMEMFCWGCGPESATPTPVGAKVM